MILIDTEPDQYVMHFYNAVRTTTPPVEESPVEVADAATVFVLTDAARELLLNRPFSDEAPVSLWKPSRQNSLCGVCNYPTGEADGLCSQACRNTVSRGRRGMASPLVGGVTHLRHVSGCGTMPGGGTGGAMKRRFNADNQKLQLN